MTQSPPSAARTPAVPDAPTPVSGASRPARHGPTPLTAIVPRERAAAGVIARSTPRAARGRARGISPFPRGPACRVAVYHAPRPIEDLLGVH